MMALPLSLNKASRVPVSGWMVLLTVVKKYLGSADKKLFLLPDSSPFLDVLLRGKWTCGPILNPHQSVL